MEMDTQKHKKAVDRKKESGPERHTQLGQQNKMVHKILMHIK